MADTSALLAALRDFEHAFEHHALSLNEEYEQLYSSWTNLSDVFEGDAAEDFTQQWSRTLAVFQEYMAGSEDVIALLSERVEALADANRPKATDT